jgi:hypothetical protein
MSSDHEDENAETSVHTIGQQILSHLLNHIVSAPFRYPVDPY